MSAHRAVRFTTEVRYPLARTRRLSVETVAGRSGLHPDLVRRFVALGLLDAVRDPSGRLQLTEDAPVRVARIQRLRAGLCLNYASIGLVLDLLDRIEDLEAAVRSGGPAPVRPDPLNRTPPRHAAPQQERPQQERPQPEPPRPEAPQADQSAPRSPTSRPDEGP
jgi:chaperone modulatory protein CbpM